VEWCHGGPAESPGMELTTAATESLAYAPERVASLLCISRFTVYRQTEQMTFPWSASEACGEHAKSIWGAGRRRSRARRCGSTWLGKASEYRGMGCLAMSDFMRGPLMHVHM